MIETREAIENLDSILDLEVRAILGKANKNSDPKQSKGKQQTNNRPGSGRGFSRPS